MKESYRENLASSSGHKPYAGSGDDPGVSNVYLHYVFDLWIQWWRERCCHGDMVVVRYADDFVIGFEHRAEAEACLEELRARFARFGLKLHDGKTRLIEFGRFAASNRRGRGEKRPETFDFLGFTHKCARRKSEAEVSSFTVIRWRSGCGRHYRRSGRNCARRCTCR